MVARLPAHTCFKAHLPQAKVTGLIAADSVMLELQSVKVWSPVMNQYPTIQYVIYFRWGCKVYQSVQLGVYYRRYGNAVFALCRSGVQVISVKVRMEELKVREGSSSICSGSCSVEHIVANRFPMENRNQHSYWTCSGTVVLLSFTPFWKLFPLMNGKLVMHSPEPIAVKDSSMSGLECCCRFY